MLIPALAAAAVWTVGTASQGLPAGVTADMVRQGRQLFTGAGQCSTCHGADARGIPMQGGDLTDRQWTHSDGSYRGILSTIEEGVAAERSGSGIPMPPRAGANLSDEQARALAAYVWTLSQGGG